MKDVAEDLITLIRAELSKLDQWREKEATRNRVQTAFYNFLYDEGTGLPVGVYSSVEVKERSSRVYQHVFRLYDTAEPGVFSAAA